MSNERTRIRAKVPGARVYRRERSKAWQLQYQSEGRRIRVSSGLSDEDEAWLELERIYDRGQALTFKDAAVDFFEIKRRSLAPTTIKGYLFALQSVDPHFGDQLMSEISLPGIKKFVSERRRQVSDTTVKRELAFLSSVFTHAQVSMEGAPEINPILGYSKRHLKEKARDVFLTTEEFESLQKACRQEWQRSVLLTAVLTGMRHGELLQFRKSWINWERGTCGEIQLPQEFTKSKRPRIVPIFPQLSDTLRKQIERNDSPWVFNHQDPPRPYSSFQGFFRNARREAGMDTLRFHDLRHTFASWWVQKGGSLLVLKEILGHANLQMVQRYAHLDTDATHREMAGLL